MNGNERLIVLIVYLILIAVLVVALTVAFLNGTIDFDRYTAQSVLAIGLVGALLVRLPQSKSEVEQQTAAENVSVEGENVEVTESK